MRPPLPGRRRPAFPPSVLPASWIQGSPQCLEQHPRPEPHQRVFSVKEAPGGRLGPGVRAPSEAPGRAPPLSASPQSGRQGCVGAHSRVLHASPRGFHVKRRQDCGCPGQGSRGHLGDGAFLVSPQAASSAERRVAAGGPHHPCSCSLPARCPAALTPPLGGETVID